MADKKISALPVATTPLAGTEVLPIVQSGSTDQVSVANLTAGRSVSALSVTAATIGAGSGSNLSLQANGTTKATLTASNVLGLNAVPNSWSAHTVLQTGELSSFGSFDGNNNLQLMNNAYWDGSAYKRIISGIKASYYSQIDGVHGWYNDSSTTGDVTFSQGMELDANKNLKLNAGNLVIGTSGKGIDFSADGQAAGMTSELLDDYEEGTWTPIVYGGTTPGTTTYSTQVGTYTKIGRLVTCQLECTWSDQTGTGSLYVAGLPFVAAAGQPSSGFLIFNGFLDPNLGSGALVIGSDTKILTYTFTAGGFGNIYAQFSYLA